MVVTLGLRMSNSSLDSSCVDFVVLTSLFFWQMLESVLLVFLEGMCELSSRKLSH